jgi:phage tail-like protein
MSSLNNLEYLYNHLPTRYRVADAEHDLFLKRFLSVVGEELDGFDLKLDTLFEKVAPVRYTLEQNTEWTEFFLYALFGWGWFPPWFTAEQKRAFYGGISRLYAMRGTARGIEEFLSAFGIKARVIVSTPAVGELTLGEDEWLMAEPLGIVVQVFPDAAAVQDDLDAIGEFAVGESHVATPSQSLERSDLDRLLRFQWPLGQAIFIQDKTATL